MNYRILIHALILIFIIHIIIINIDYEINIGKKIENFKNNSSNEDKKKDNKSLDFLLENKDNDNEFMAKMKSISDSQILNTKEKDDSVIPSNGFLNNENIPNFESNVEDTSKFYKIQNNYDNLNENDLKTTSIEDLNKKSNNVVVDVPPNHNTNTRKSEDKPATWEYNNELAMNGALMNGISGFDGLESQYANFGTPINLESSKNNYENIPHDDLRKPVVVN